MTVLGLGMVLLGVVFAIREGRLSAAAPFVLGGAALVLAGILVPGY